MTHVFSLLNAYESDLCVEIYDLDKPPGSLPDVPFYRRRLIDVGGPILEAGVGTGRMLIPLLEDGHRVEGFDASETMLARCAANCAARGLSPPLQRMRFQDFAYDHGFAAIIVPVSSFSFVTGFDEALAVLRRFHDHLLPGGLLIMAMEPLAGLFGEGNAVRSWTAVNGDLLTMEARVADTDGLAQLRATHYRYERWRDGKLIAAEFERLVMRYWGKEEFALALKQTGFDGLTITGNYDPARAVRRSDRILTYETRRP